jgi:two-component system, cell cycle sensor histidine kinase and response regulator CckA
VVVTLLDAVALVAAAIAAFVTLRGNTDPVRTLVLFLLGLLAFDAFCNILEWSGITARLDIYEDFVSVLQPALWFYLVHTATQERTARHLRESEENLRITLDAICDGVLACDHEGRIVRLNPVAERLTGWSAAEAVGRPVSEVFVIASATTREPSPDPVRHVLESGQSKELANDTILKARDGVERQIADAGSPIRDSLGRTVGVVLVFRDVTERHALEEQFRQAQKMESVGRLAGGVVHDFNNLLTAITGYADLLRVTLPADSDCHRFAELVLTSARRASALTTKLLAFSRKGAQQASTVDVHGLIDEVVEILRHTIDRRITVHRRFDAGTPLLLADPNLLESALLNLAINACDAMSDGGELTFATSNSGRHDDPSAPPSLVVTVSDSGHGMDAATQTRIFEPFFTTKAAGHGTGLGLSAVQGIVADCGGSIRVESTPGAGSTFTLVLPLAETLLDAAPASTVPPVAERRSSGRILVVDDEDSIRELLDHLLRREGYDVVLATNGIEALEAFHASPGAFDAVVLDLVMPRLSGSATFDRLRSTAPEIPVVVSSGFSAEGYPETMARDPRVRFLPKPYEAADMLDLLAELIATTQPRTR